ncbi:MAG TPA: hypothetical protein VEW48_11065 [Thermoanaerobaculia bacterium]|nr:hypothetical protein [Thermoanaerobaculia bacterium]
MEENKDLNQVDNVEIEPLSDEDLESASGGCISNSCSGSGCSSDLADAV